MINKKSNPTKLLWLDLEMTGLEPQKDLILEIALIVTDFNFDILDTYQTNIRHPKATVVNRMQANSWWQDYPKNRDMFVNNLESGKELVVAEKEIIKIINKNFNNEPVILAGNSIYNDRLFIKQWMENLETKLHYRMLDVSAWKVLMQGKYNTELKKPEIHRAFDDIKGSIAELQYYIDWFSQYDGS